MTSCFDGAESPASATEAAPAGADAVLAPTAEPVERERFAAQPFHRYLGVELLDQRDGYARLVLRPRPDTPAGVAGSVHGGVLATLVDVAALCAIRSAVGPDDVMAGT